MNVLLAFGGLFVVIYFT